MAVHFNTITSMSFMGTAHVDPARFVKEIIQDSKIAVVDIFLKYIPIRNIGDRRQTLACGEALLIAFNMKVATVITSTTP